MTAPAFERARLRLARELMGWSQTQLANALGLSGAAISQFEGGATRPGTDTIGKLSTILQVPVSFFEKPVAETHDGFFRSLRRTAVADRRRARAIAHLAHDLAIHADTAQYLGPLSIPQIPISDLSTADAEIEEIAGRVRAAWGLPPGPVPNVVSLLEDHGIVVIRLPLGTADVDAFSLPFPDHPVVVLGTDKNDRARSRFDAAHELGHLIMHGEQIWGIPAIEKQAHTFAAAFLMPASEIKEELPDMVDWPALFKLKQRWQVSLAALLMRAKTLNRITEAAYVTAIKAASARGWRRTEPVPLGAPEQPRQLLTFLRSTASEPAHADLPAHTIDAIAKAATVG